MKSCKLPGDRTKNLAKVESMRTTRLVLAGLVFSLVGSLVLAAPQAIDIPEDALKGKLRDEHIKMIADFTDNWAKQMMEAKDTGGIAAARNRILDRNDGYGKYDSAEYKYTYAREAVRSLLPVLDASDALKNYRIVDAAYCISKMPQISVLPALEKMVGHTNPAVRYYAWICYRQLCPALMGVNKDNIAKIFQTMDAKMPTETSPKVVEAMLAMMSLPSSEPGVSEDVVKFAQGEAYTILMKNWPALCQAILAGNADTTFACQEGMSALNYFGGVFASDKAKMTAIQQSMVDAMWCAALAYDAAKKLADSSDGMTKSDAEQTIEADSALLRAGEAAINTTVGQKYYFISAPLVDPKEKAGLGVLEGVTKWVAALKASGVNQPAFKLPEVAQPTSGPASGPASAPASGPASKPATAPVKAN
jgi:hypothetical protein